MTSGRARLGRDSLFVSRSPRSCPALWRRSPAAAYGRSSVRTSALTPGSEELREADLPAVPRAGRGAALSPHLRLAEYRPLGRGRSRDPRAAGPLAARRGRGAALSPPGLSRELRRARRLARCPCRRARGKGRLCVGVPPPSAGAPAPARPTVATLAPRSLDEDAEEAGSASVSSPPPSAAKPRSCAARSAGSPAPSRAGPS